MNELLDLIGRSQLLFLRDMEKHALVLKEKIRGARILVIGGAGTIGQAVVRELFSRDPDALHVVDISENNLAELVRDIRSDLGYGTGEFLTLPLDVGSQIMNAFLDSQKPYDYLFNLSAMKHVRSEKDPWSIMRMIEVNIENSKKMHAWATRHNMKNYFCVSTDKAAAPANLMGASKRAMEYFLLSGREPAHVSMARFANVAFSDGSLPHGFTQRIRKKQPISAPDDVKRYFLIPKESGELCILSGLLGENRDIFFPKLDAEAHMVSFKDIAVRYLDSLGYEAVGCASEEEARRRCHEWIPLGKWPCYFFKSDTTGEKMYEEFFTEGEKLELARFDSIGIVKNESLALSDRLPSFENALEKIRSSKPWKKEDLVRIFQDLIPDFRHEEKNKNLDQRM